MTDHRHCQLLRARTLPPHPSGVMNWRDVVDRMASDPQRNQSSTRTEIEAGELLHEPSRLFVFVGFSDDRRLALVVRFGVVVFVLVIIIVIGGVSWRHRVAHDGDEPPLGSGKVLRDAMGHVGSLLDVPTFMRGCYRAAPMFSKRSPT
jgi:hypothetical protein